MRADSGFYTHAIVAVCRKLDVRFSITIRQHQSLRNLTLAIPEGDWTPVPYWMDGAADVAETAYTLSQKSKLTTIIGISRNYLHESQYDIVYLLNMTFQDDDSRLR